MLPGKVKITNEDIVYAERILLPQGIIFDAERQDFIKNLDTIDLQAVPGSGKTTALLAKLLILEKYLPFNDGSGILVLSHTNVAIDEIKNRIGKYCPKLFSYPNFVGTIQSFVDQLFAIPYYVNKYKKKPFRIDKGTYDDKIEKRLSELWLYRYKLSNEDLKKVQHIAKVNPSKFYNFRFSINNERKIILTEVLNGKMLEIKKLRGKTKKENYYDYSDEVKKKLYEWFIIFKYDLLENERSLHFDDAYFLAKLYLQIFPQIKELLQKRFQFVFVDEMQDMDKHQHDLLENIFYEDGKSLSKYQRIGDLNQAIHNNITSDDCWTPRANSLKLSGSNRLTPEVAKVIKCFGLDYQEIEGLRESCNLKPHIMVFEDPQKVLLKFTEIIKNYELDKMETDNKYPFHAIGWTTHKTEEEKNSDKIRLQDYYDNYEKDQAKPKIDYKNLKSHLFFYDKEKPTLEPIRSNILNAFLKIIRFERKKDENERDYTKNNFLKYLRNTYPKKYEEFKLRIYQWSFEIKKGNIETIFPELKKYIPIFLKNVFNIYVLKSETQNFLNDELLSESNSISNFLNISEKKNVYVNEDNGIEVKVGTVHSVKGKTHTATLYLESFFYKDGDKSYESQRLINQLKNETVKDSVGKRVKQSAKMVYVGFSRPTHLLCFAIHKDRFSTDFENDNWEIINCN